MSIEVMSQVWKHSTHKSGSLIVLLAMADFAHDDGAGIFASIKTLARKSRLRERQVQRVIRTLLASGELVLVDEGGGRHQTNTYRIPMPFGKGVIKTPFQKGVIGDTKRVSSATGKGVAQDTPNRQESSIEPLAARRERRPRKTGQVNSSYKDAICRRSASFRALNDGRQQVLSEIETLTHPGGCAPHVEPTDQVKRSQLKKARARLKYFNRELDALTEAEEPAA